MSRVAVLFVLPEAHFLWHAPLQALLLQCLGWVSLVVGFAVVALGLVCNWGQQLRLRGLIHEERSTPMLACASN